jgi:hypothetical protein
MERLALRTRACKEFRRRRGAPPSIALTESPAALQSNVRGSDDVANADAAVLFALVFDAARQ